MGEDFKTNAVETLARLLLNYEENRPVDGTLDPAVWLARIQEQLAIAATVAKREKKAALAGQDEQADEEAQTVGAKLIGVACECIGALAQLDGGPVAAAKQATLRLIDRGVAEQLDENRDSHELMTTADWVIETTALLGVPAAAVGHIDDRQRDLPDPRDTGSISLRSTDDPDDVLTTGLRIAAVHATTASHYLLHEDRIAR